MINQVLEEKILKFDKSNWKLTKLGTLAEDISVRVDKPGESVYDRFVGLDNFVSGDIKIKSWASTKNLTSSAKAFKAGDILFARRNAYLRRASLVDFDGCCSGDAFVIRENADKVVPGFLAFLMNTNSLWDYANSNAAGTMSKRVKWRDLAEYQFLLPPKAEQTQLAELLWAMDEVIEKEKELLDRAEKLKKAKLKEIFKKENCRKVKIGSISESLDNRRIPIKSSIRINGEYPYYGASGIVDYVSNFIFDEEILLISEDGENLVSRNLPIAYSVDGKCWVNNHAHVLKITKGSRYLVKEYFNFTSISDFIASGTRPKLNKGVLMEMPIYLPHEGDDIKYERELLAIDYSILNSINEISSSRTLQKSLINQIF